MIRGFSFGGKLKPLFLYKATSTMSDDKYIQRLEAVLNDLDTTDVTKVSKTFFYYVIDKCSASSARMFKSKYNLSSSVIIGCIQRACKDGHLETLKKLKTAFGITKKDICADNNEAFQWAALYEHLHILKWLTETFGLTKKDACAQNNEAFRSTVGNGDMESAKWMHATFGMTTQDVLAQNNEAFRNAVENGCIDMAKWLNATFGVSPLDTRDESDYEDSDDSEDEIDPEIQAWLDSI